MDRFGGKERFEKAMDEASFSSSSLESLVSDTRRELAALCEIDFSQESVCEVLSDKIRNDQEQFRNAGIDSFDNHFHCKDLNQIESLFDRYVSEGFQYVNPSEHYSVALSRKFRELSEQKGVDLKVPFDCAEIVVKQDDVIFHAKVYVDPRHSIDDYLNALHAGKQKLSFPSFEDLRAWSLRQGIPLCISVAHPDIINPSENAVIQSRDVLYEKGGIDAFEIGHRDLDAESYSYYLSEILMESMVADGGSDYHGYSNEESLGVSRDVSLKDLYIAFGNRFSRSHFAAMDAALEKGDRLVVQDEITYLQKQYGYLPHIHENLFSYIEQLQLETVSSHDVLIEDDVVERARKWSRLYFDNPASFSVHESAFLSDIDRYGSDPRFMSHITFVLESEAFCESLLYLPDDQFESYCKSVVAQDSKKAYSCMKSLYDLISDMDTERRFCLYKIARKYDYDFFDDSDILEQFRPMYFATENGLESQLIPFDSIIVLKYEVAEAVKDRKYRYALDLFDAYYLGTQGVVDPFYLQRYKVMRSAGEDVVTQKDFLDTYTDLLTLPENIEVAKDYLDLCMQLDDYNSGISLCDSYQGDCLDTYLLMFEYRRGVVPVFDFKKEDVSRLSVQYCSLKQSYEAEDYDKAISHVEVLLNYERENKYTHSFVRKLMKVVDDVQKERLCAFLESKNISTSRLHFKSRLESRINPATQIQFLNDIASLLEVSENSDLCEFVSQMVLDQNLSVPERSGDIKESESELIHRLSSLFQEIGDEMYEKGFCKAAVGLLS